jgi:hypothetical protein
MKTFADIIDAFGEPDGPPAKRGVAVVAKVLRIDESHVRTMKARNSIPPEYWSRLVEKAAAHGVDLDYQKLHRLRDVRYQSACAS